MIMKRFSRLNLYKFFQVGHPFEERNHRPTVALKWAGLSLLALLVGGFVLAAIVSALWALYTQAWVWVRIVATPLLFVPLLVLWLAWPSKKKQAAVFLEQGQ